MNMDVVNPELVWLDGRCYRKNPSRNNYGIVNRNSNIGDLPLKDEANQYRQCQSTPKSVLPYKEYDDSIGCDPDAPDDHIDEGCDYEIEELQGGGFRTYCQNIPNTLYAVVIGPRGAVKKRIEDETNTKITIPRINESGDIVIRGQKRQNVVRSRRRIDIITSQGRFKREATHFLCFPLNSQSIIKNVQEFKEKVLLDFKDETMGITEKLFQEPEKIHLTLCVVMLLDQNERKLATNILEQLKEKIQEIASFGILRCRLQGLEIMNDDATQANILFAKCEFQDNTVQVLANLIHQKFIETGFAKIGRSDAVKLHATLLNVRYRDSETSTEPSVGGNRAATRFVKGGSFNAQNILEKYGDYDFGFVEIKEVHISTRHTKGPDGFYNAFARIPIK